ncbi:g4112 [Coccomyxa elongata]
MAQNKAQNKKDLAEAGRRKLEAFRKQKGGGKAKGSRTPPVDKNLGAENPGPSEAFQLTSTLQPEDGGPAQHNSHSKAADADLVPVTTSGSYQRSAGGSEPVSERPEDSLPSSRSGQDTGEVLQVASSTATSTVPPLFRPEQPAMPATDKWDDQRAAAALAALSTKPLAAPGTSSSRGFLSMPFPAPPPLPLPPPPPQFNFTISQPPTIPEQTRNSPHSGVPFQNGDSSQSSSSSSGQVTAAVTMSGGGGPEIIQEHGEGQGATSTTAKLERDPFGSNVHPAEELPPPPPAQLSSSESSGTTQDVPSVPTPSPAAGSYSHPPTLAGLQQVEEIASPLRPAPALSSAPSSAQDPPIAQVESTPPMESVAIPATGGYAALSDGYLSPSRLDAGSPSPARQKEPGRGEELPVSRSAGLNRLDSVSPGPPNWASGAAAMGPRSMQGPSSSNGYSTLSDGYLGRQAGDSSAAERDGHAAFDTTLSKDKGWLGNRGGIAAGSHGGGSMPDNQGLLYSGAKSRASEAGSSFADLFDAVLSNSPGPKKQSWLSSPGIGSGGAARGSQDSDQPPQQGAVGNASQNPSTPLWQQKVKRAMTSSATASTGVPGPPPPTAAPTVDLAAAEGRKADADSSSADPWAKPSRPLLADLAAARRPSADGDASKDGETGHDGVGPSETAAAQNGDYGPGSWLRPSPPVSVAGPATGDRDRFAALQQYIDELTQEKYELLRGMSSQRKVAETLEAQNQAIAEDFNCQAAQMGALREELTQLHAEVNAQRMALAAIAAERDAARSSATDSAERLKRLAAEVVDLEERVLRARSNELRAEKEAAAAAQAARRAHSAVQSALLERGNLQSIVDTLQEEKCSLHVKLRKAVLGERLRQEQPPKDASTQTTTAAAAASPAKLPANPRERGAQHASSEIAPSTVAPTVRLAADALEQHEAAHASADEGPSEEPLSPALSHLLPPLLYKGGVAGSAAELITQERAALSNIHAMLESLESQQRSLLSSLHAKQEENRELDSENWELRSRLEAAQQRLELAVSRSAFAAAATQLPQQPPAGAGGASSGVPPAAARQLFTESAPTTPAPAPRRPLRAPKEAEPRRGALNWVLEFLVPHPQSSQRISQFG